MLIKALVKILKTKRFRKGSQKKPSSELLNSVAGSHGTVFTLRGSTLLLPCEQKATTWVFTTTQVNPINLQLTDAQVIGCVLYCLMLIDESLRISSKIPHCLLYTKKPTLLTFSSSSLHPFARELLRRFSACQKTALHNTAYSLQKAEKTKVLPLFINRLSS